MNRHDGALRVVGAGQQHGGLDLFEAVGICADLGLKIAEYVFAFARQLEKRIEIRRARGQLGLPFKGLFQAFAVLQKFLALFRLVPEIGRRDLLLELS
jgi:hypothetical protein